jgi:gliding motility-associated protein GldC
VANYFEHQQGLTGILFTFATKLKRLMKQSTIKIDVFLDPNKIPEQINWQATDSSADMSQKAKAMSVAFWDGADKTALRIDLWTKDLMVDEMGDFYYQMLMGMADSFKRSTNQEGLSNELKVFAKDFFEKFRELQAKEQG